MPASKNIEVTFRRAGVQPSTRPDCDLTKVGDVVSVPREEAALYEKRGWAVKGTNATPEEPGEGQQ